MWQKGKSLLAGCRACTSAASATPLPTASAGSEASALTRLRERLAAEGAGLADFIRSGGGGKVQEDEYAVAAWSQKQRNF